MHGFTSKELYIANGGRKIYIYLDGFMDVYKATPEEEAEWAKEVVTNALKNVEKTKDATSLEMAISNLVFHEYAGLKELLLTHLKDQDPERRKVFETAFARL